VNKYLAGRRLCSTLLSPANRSPRLMAQQERCVPNGRAKSANLPFPLIAQYTNLKYACYLKGDPSARARLIDGRRRQKELRKMCHGVFRICKNDFHLSARYSNPGERAPSIRDQSQITLIITAVERASKRRWTYLKYPMRHLKQVASTGQTTDLCKLSLL
jgi:hypothetical protein